MPKAKNISKGERTRKAIMDAAHEVFLEKGFHAASMRQVAKGAGLALGGIYNHFESKEEIFSAIVRARHPYKRILPIALAAEGDDIETFAHNTGRAIVRELSENSDYVNLLFIEILEFKGKHMAEIFQDIFPQVLPLLERFQAGNTREFPPMMLMRIFIGTFISYYLTEISFGEVAMPNMQEDAMQHFVDVFLHGVLEVEK
ncbi:MAG: TetR/AcrR family transcriptional regulator [Anaerolineae bacterium]|jgi:AcrR family transcriptional regulator|nr:TetR/AcrR family transcriptional regulator [Anaerolineae bacterium]MBT7192072.1 TetR/AcrR family transcriptional regulator [Anaerolineae bacterium]MBT7990148.1 TetR/AcrR family transcriptional regulator [Anaerolineae bacterium]